ncbi:MAG: hypothetical protein E7A86_18345, partial [Bradyrhizobium sp.]|nr:hypothetical protein [Bradyrhizobium sp.]
MMAACEISGLSAIADRFDHVLLDQWGTLHDGRTVFPVALDCLARLREAGKRVLVLSNSGKRASQNAERLARLGVPRSAYDGILTSGEVTWNGLRERNRAPFTDCGRACFLITRGGDRSLTEGLDLVIVSDLREADFILLGGLDDKFDLDWLTKLAGQVLIALFVASQGVQLTTLPIGGLTLI